MCFLILEKAFSVGLQLSPLKSLSFNKLPSVVLETFKLMSPAPSLKLGAGVCPSEKWGLRTGTSAVPLAGLVAGSRGQPEPLKPDAGGSRPLGEDTGLGDEVAMRSRLGRPDACRDLGRNGQSTGL